MLRALQRMMSSCGSLNFETPTPASFAAAGEIAANPTSARHLLPFAALGDEASPAGALAAWTAVVAGSWELVASLDAGGRRHLLAQASGPERTTFRAPCLSTQVLDALALLGRGHAQKFIGYELGMSPAQLSRLIGSARTALGISSRATLVRVAGAALGGSCAALSRWRRFADSAAGVRQLGPRMFAWGQPLARAERSATVEQNAARFETLTHAEREVCVLAMLGHDDRAIAARRGTSTRTVAVQMGCAFRKLGVGGRNELVVGYAAFLTTSLISHNVPGCNK